MSLLMPGPPRNRGSDTDRPMLTNYVREWRKYRELNLERLAEKADLSVSTVSAIERKRQDFTGKTLRQLADALDTTPASLIAGPPARAGEIWSIWEDLGRRNRQADALAVLKALRDTTK